MLNVVELKCEYIKNPMGIGERKPRFSWKLNADAHDLMQAAYRIQVSKENSSFANPIWDSGKVNSDNSIHVEYAGPELDSRIRYYFRVRINDNKGNESPWSENGIFETGILDKNDWLSDFISADADENPEFSSTCPLFRKEFTVTGEILSARVYATSRGLYEVQLNGCKVGEYLLTPGWTSYNKRLQYQTYDVTDMLGNGDNAIGAVIGNGWYRGPLATWTGDDCTGKYGKRTAFFLQLHIKYTDGREQIIVTDESWKTTDSPILMSEIYHGETYDARLEKQDWDKPGFNDTDWTQVHKVKVDRNILLAQEGVPIKAIETIKPLKIFETPAGETVVDMGQNMVGWVRFCVKGPRGSRVVLKHGEMLDKYGNFYNENLRTAKQTVEYILKGEGTETFKPHFTFLGFRYVKLEEYPVKPELDDFTGIVIHSGMEKTGSFSCSNELINKLQHNIYWSQKGNFIDVPIDCPQRDERLGWTGDAQIYARTACFNMNVAPFYTKWLADFKADQYKSGSVSMIIPDIKFAIPGEHTSSAWGDAAVIIPWTVYLCYGDKRLLKRQYDSMKRWVEYVYGQAENGLIWNNGFHFGDWLGLDAKEGSYVGATAIDLIATAFYANSVSLFAKVVEVLQKHDDAEKYRKLHANIVKAFQQEFFSPAGRLCVPTQTAHVLVLMFELVEEKFIKRTVDTLIQYIEENDWHLTTGFLGTPYLCHVLSRYGRPEVAYKLLLQTDFPSWLYQVTNGATTMWEHMDGQKPDGSFWSHKMCSFNQYAYGSIGDWMYRIAAGIDTDEAKPGYKHIVLRPYLCREFMWVAAELESMYGTIKSKWSINDGRLMVEVAIPHNTTASVKLPYAKICGLEENGTPVRSLPFVSKIMEDKEGVTLELGSGGYFFSYTFDIDSIPVVDLKRKGIYWG